MWFVALSHRPHFPSLPLPLSVSLSLFPSTWRGFFLPSFNSCRPTGKLDRIASLRWLTQKHRELHSTPRALQPRQPTSPHPGLDPSPPLPACFYVSLTSCPCRCMSSCVSFSVSFCLPGCHFLYPSVRLLPHQDVSLFTCVYTPICLSVFLPTCTACLNTLWICFGPPSLLVVFVSLLAFPPLSFSLSLGTRLQSQNTEGHRAYRLPGLHAKLRRLGKKYRQCNPQVCQKANIGIVSNDTLFILPVQLPDRVVNISNFVLICISKRVVKLLTWLDLDTGFAVQSQQAPWDWILPFTSFAIQ